MLKVFTIIDVLKSNAGSAKNVGRKQNVHVIGSAVGNLISGFQKCCYRLKLLKVGKKLFVVAILKLQPPKFETNIEHHITYYYTGQYSKNNASLFH